MKIFKRLASAAIAVAMIASVSTVAFADALNFPAKTYEFYANKATITQGTTTFKVSFGIKDTAGADVNIPNNDATDVENYVGVDSYAYAKLSAEAIAAGIKATAIESDVVTIVDPCFFIDGEGAEGDLFGASFAYNKGDVTLNAATPLFAVTFTAPADIAEGTYKLLDADSSTYTLSLLDKDSKPSGNVDWSNLEFVTVTAGSDDDDDDDDQDSIISAPDANGVRDIADTAATEALKGKKVVFKEASFPTGHKIGAATQLKVTNNNITTDNVRYFGSNLLEALGVETAGGTFEASKVKFGIVFDAEYTTWTAANFTFELVNTVE